MTVAKVGLAGYGIGAPLLFLGLYGAPGSAWWSLFTSAIGLVALLVGIGALFICAVTMPLSRPHPAVIAIGVLGLVMYAYVHAFPAWAIPFWLWAMTPYLLCIFLSSIRSMRIAAVFGAAAVLVFDALVHYDIATSKGSTGAIAYIFTPLWSALALVPLVTLVAWFVIQRKRRGVQHAT